MLAVPVVALIAWFAAQSGIREDWIPALITMGVTDLASLVWLAVVLYLVVIVVRRIIGLLMPGENRHVAGPSGESVRRKHPKGRVSRNWERLTEDYWPEYADWVIAQVDDRDYEVVREFAEQNYDKWNDAGKRTDDSLARHEAAHAVVARALGMVVTKVSIEPQIGTLGRVDITLDLDAPSYAEAVWSRIAAQLAGGIIDSESGVYGGGSNNDNSLALRDIMSVIASGTRPRGYEGPMTIEGIVADRSKVAREIIDQNRDRVDSLASELLSSGTVPPWNVRHMLRDIRMHESVETAIIA